MGSAKIIPEDTILLPYQARWVKDPARLKIAEKSRQIGWTWATGYGLVRRKAMRAARLDAWISSRDDIQARLFLEDCKGFAGLLQAGAEDMGERAVDNDGHSAYVLRMANGLRIHSMSSNPDAQAGKRGDRVLDEFALHPDPRKLYAIAYPGITWGGSLEIFSTHRGSQNFFNSLVAEIRDKGNPKGFSLHRVTLQDALEQGFLAKLQSKLPPDDERQGMDEAAYFDFIKSGCADEESFLQEYMCAPSDDAAAFIGYDLLDGCKHPAGSDWRTVGNGSLYLGVDIGRVHDLTVFWMAEDAGGVLMTRLVSTLRNATFDEQERVFHGLMDTHGIRRACIDNTGIGRQFAERGAKRYGSRVEPVTFTGQVKESLAYPLKAAMEDRTFRIPDDRDIFSDFRAIRKTTTSAGNIRFEGERTKDGHSDRFWAAALCRSAASRPAWTFAPRVFDLRKDPRLQEGVLMDGKRIKASFAAFWRELSARPGRRGLGEKSEYCAWSETINPLRGLTEQKARDIFDNARRGIYADLTWLYQEIEAADPTLLACTERRESVVGASDWKIVACNPERTRGYDQTLADDQAAFLREAYGRAEDSLSEVAEHLERGFFRGFAHARPVYGEGDATLEGFELYDPWNFAYDRLSGQWWWNPDATSLYSDNMTPVPDGELVSVVRQRHIDYPALLIFIRAALGEKKYGVWLERYGIPPVTVIMPPEAAKGDEQAYFDAAQRLAAAGYGAVPNGTTVSYATEARGVNPFLEFLRHQQELVVLMATGGTLTSLASPTGIGSGASDAQMAVWREIVRRDIRVSARAINRTVTPRLLAHRFPGRPALAMFEFDPDPAPTAQEAFADAAVAKSAGYLVEQSQLEEASGYKLAPDPAQQVAAQPQMAQTWPGGYPAAQNKADNPDCAVASPLQNARSGEDDKRDGHENKTRQNASDAVLAELGKSLAADLSPVADRVAALLALPEAEQADAAKALMADLPGLLPADPQMAAVLEEAVAEAFAGAVAGTGDYVRKRKITATERNKPQPL